MRILHTSDWHIGKRIGRFDRSEEHRRVIDEVVDIADREKVDLVIHSGDLFERPIPPIHALELGLDGLVRLTDGARRPVVAIAGNHDSPGLFETLARFLTGQNIHLVGEVKPPDRGAVLDLITPGGRAVVSCFPFLREGRTFNVWQPPEEALQTVRRQVARDQRGVCPRRRPQGGRPRGDRTGSALPRRGCQGTRARRTAG